MAAVRLRNRAAGLLGATVLAVALLVAGAGSAVASTPSATTAANDAQLVFQLLNRERANHGLPALRWSWKLTSAAHAHNLKEARYNSLSHQLPGELSLGARITAAGYQWSALGENLGRTQDWSATGVLALHKMFFHEVWPNNIHRRNILSKTYRHVGIDVYMDAAHHVAWLTEDFAAPL